jgi:hypothetical protein
MKVYSGLLVLFCAMGMMGCADFFPQAEPVSAATVTSAEVSRRTMQDEDPYNREVTQRDPLRLDEGDPWSESAPAADNIAPTWGPSASVDGF